MAWFPRRRTVGIALVLIATVVAWIWLLATLGADGLVTLIGAENGYLAMFLVALFGGLATFTSITYFATVLTLGSAGLDPIGLAVASTLGISTGDVIFYFVGYFGVRQVATGLLESYILRINRYLEGSSRVFIFAVVYCYAAFTPLPNDLLALVFGTARQPLLLILPAFILGNFTLVLLLAVFGSYLTF